MNLREDLIALLHQPSLCYVATLMPDGSPQMTQTWVDTDGEHIVINTVQGFQKLKNVERDPRVAVSVSDPSNPSRYYAVRGRVVGITTKGGAEHIESLAQRYLGGPYPWYGGRDQVRVVLTISAEKSTAWGRRRTSTSRPERRRWPCALPGAHLAKARGREARRDHGSHRLQQGALLDHPCWHLDTPCVDMAGARGARGSGMKAR